MKKLLIADDNLQVVDSIRNMFESIYSVQTARTGTEVIIYCKENDYDGIIVDADLGAGISGLEAVELIRKDFPQTKIIVFSAIELSDTAIAWLNALDIIFCKKPLNVDFAIKYLESLRI